MTDEMSSSNEAGDHLPVSVKSVADSSGKTITSQTDNKQVPVTNLSDETIPILTDNKQVPATNLSDEAIPILTDNKQVPATDLSGEITSPTDNKQVPVNNLLHEIIIPSTESKHIPAGDGMACQNEMSLYELVQTDLVRCPYCTEVYTYPCILPCLHSVCGACIDKLHQPSSGEGGAEVTVNCPTCQTTHPVPLYGFPCNHFLCNLIEIYDMHQDEEIPCTYCQYEFEESTAIIRCIDCQDNLCQACAAAHKKTKITRNHVLAPFEQIKLSKYDLDIRRVQKVNCNKHAVEACTQYCETCRQLFCDECHDHKRHDFIPIGSKTLTELQQVKVLTQTINDRLPAYNNYKEFLQDYSDSLVSKQDELVKSINTKTELLHAIIDKQQHALLERVESKVSLAMDGIEKELAVVENLSNSYSSNLQFVQALVEHSKPEELIDLQMIISQRLQQVNCNEMRQSLEDRLSISCTTSPSEEECEQTICQLIGDVSISLQSWHQHGESLVDEDESEWYVKGECDKRTSIFSPTAKSPELLRIPVLCVEFNSDLSTDSNNTWPTGVCTTVLGDIAICDRDNALIKIFTPTGIHKTSFSGELEYTLKKPFDITSLSTGELVVSDYGTESVKVFDLSGIGRLMICGEFEYPRGVAADRDDNILVLDTELGRVTIHSSTDGKLLQVVKGTSPLTNMIDPYYLCVSRHGDVIVTDFAEPNVKILSVNGAELPELNYGEYGVTTRQGLLQPYGCCQDVYGITFIADNRNDKISVLMPNGRFEQHLLTRRDGLWQPIALCIDMKGQLIVTEGLGKVKIYKYI